MSSGTINHISIGDETFDLPSEADDIKQIEEALDEILLENGGSVVTNVGVDGLQMPDENGKYHKIALYTDPETGEVSLSVVQEATEDPEELASDAADSGEASETTADA